MQKPPLCFGTTGLPASQGRYMEGAMITIFGWVGDVRQICASDLKR